MVSWVIMGASVGICGHKVLGSLAAVGALAWYLAGHPSLPVFSLVPLLRQMKASVQEQLEEISNMIS
jgi:hypothetical protein